MMTRADIYLRSASEEQTGTPTKFDAQEQECRDLAHELAYTVRNVYREIGSGIILKRPFLNQVRHPIRAHQIQALITPDATRLSRDRSQLATLTLECEQHSVELVFLGEATNA